ncbi:fimbria/pilus periplasmic chaperone [Vibrio sp. CK2-1]|uniref:fimbria/pilus periplasmic chaperone n=1 Tax=Vibrio sp. CK2-1 TaxID=2912249 RepID=UPI001F027BA2|nr:fimbria/pilus periplasmic chaperone [Vibrio sp. CK2-1]MCF7352720.1 fimbria/pilus periplasmic chaperone [Vibrio sp. CK2-1]
MFKIISFIITSLFSISALANVMITPLSMDIDIKKPVSSYTIENKSGEQQTYLVKTYYRTMDSTGNEVNEDTKELRIFPSKIILNPQQSKRIKVMYLGKKALQDERSYRVIFEPITVGEQEGMKFNYRFVTSVYVTPEKAEHNIVAKMDAGKVSIQNLGNKHTVLSNWGLVFNLGSSEEVTYKDALPTINMLAKSNLVLPIKPGIAPNQVNSIDILEFE